MPINKLLIEINITTKSWNVVSVNSIQNKLTTKMCRSYNHMNFITYYKGDPPPP